LDSAFVDYEVWLDDSSQHLRKQIFISKISKATFELMNIAPIDSLIDFGKFIFKEKYTINNENN
jgi:hypothetical protein